MNALSNALLSRVDLPSFTNVRGVYDLHSENV